MSYFDPVNKQTKLAFPWMLLLAGAFMERNSATGRSRLDAVSPPDKY